MEAIDGNDFDNVSELVCGERECHPPEDMVIGVPNQELSCLL